MKLARSATFILAMLAVVLVPDPSGLPAGRALANSAVAAKKTDTPPKRSLIDINHATLDELKTLPGILDANAAKIVKNRPYANKTQLSTKGVLSAATYARIRKFIIAKQ